MKINNKKFLKKVKIYTILNSQIQSKRCTKKLNSRI